MAAKVFTPGRIRQIRLVLAVMEGGANILRDVVRVQLEKASGEKWDATEILWKNWILTNFDFAKKYRFFKNLAKEIYIDKEIPTFGESDITFLSYLMSEIVTDLKPVDELKAMRNELAHGTRVEASEIEFETEFRELENISAQFFVEFPEVDLKWKVELNKMKYEDIGEMETIAKRCEAKIEQLKTCLETVKEELTAKMKLRQEKRSKQLDATTEKIGGKLEDTYETVKATTGKMQAKLEETSDRVHSICKNRKKKWLQL